MVSGSSISGPSKHSTRRARSSRRSSSGAFRRVATMARQATIVATIRGRSVVSMGMPCSRPIFS